MRDGFLPSFLNYTGGKYSVLSQIIPLFPLKYERFIDLFCGSGTVAINVANVCSDKGSEYVLNDANEYVIEILKTLNEIQADKFLAIADELIDEYHLSNTEKFGYSYYRADSSRGLADINRNKYYKLRNDYNRHVFTGYQKSVALYVLVVFSFNNQIRFNSKMEFNLPVGKRDLNQSMRKKLTDMGKVIGNHNFSFSTNDFELFQFFPNDFVYCDPPYLITTATYNENGLWSVQHEKRLLKMLDSLNDIGIRFALSNVIYHKGEKNYILINWSKKYRTHFIKKNYNNSNYQSSAKQDKTQEVLITNY